MFAPEFLDFSRRKSYNEFVNKLTKYQNRVYKVLAEQTFVIGNAERKIIQKRTTNGRRYFFMVAKRTEGNKTVERFIKVPENNTKKLLLPFQRQIEIAQYIKAHRVVNTRGVVASNYDPKRGIPFVVMETFPTKKSKIGFIEGDKGVELLGVREATQTINQLHKFHSISIQSLPARLKKILKTYPGDYKSFRREIFRHLNKKVKPLDGKGKAELFHKLLDLEWVGTFKNKAIAMILDFGNLRARSWSNEKFRNALDNVLITTYSKIGQEKIGRAIVQLSILRSHIQLSGFFENYARP